MPSDFDIAASQYDAHFTFSKIGRAQRDRVYGFLKKHIFPFKESATSVLEINCGTGHDALFLKQQGYTVVATDISEIMILEAKGKPGSEKVDFRVMDINEESEWPKLGAYDLLFSNFGGLNCLSETELRSFFGNASAALNSGGKMVLVIMPKRCLWERFYFLLKGNKKTAYRRSSGGPVEANVDGVGVPTWYYDPTDIVKMLPSELKPIKIKPIGIAIPPSYLEPFFGKRSFLLGILKTLEPLFYSRFWAKYADHYLISLQKL